MISPILSVYNHSIEEKIRIKYKSIRAKVNVYCAFRLLDRGNKRH